MEAKVWSDTSYLQVRQVIGNLHDPFAISVRAKIPRQLTDFDVVRYIPWEISHF